MKMLKNGVAIIARGNNIQFPSGKEFYVVDGVQYDDPTHSFTIVDTPPLLSPVQFKLLFTAPERIQVKTSTDPIVQDFLSIIEDPRLKEVDLSLQSTQDALSYLVSLGIITQARKDEISTGILK